MSNSDWPKWATDAAIPLLEALIGEVKQADRRPEDYKVTKSEAEGMEKLERVRLYALVRATESEAHREGVMAGLKAACLALEAMLPEQEYSSPQHRRGVRGSDSTGDPLPADAVPLMQAENPQGQVRIIRLWNEALEAAELVEDTYWIPPSVARCAVALAATDPTRAAKLMDDAERLALSVTDDSFNEAFARRGVAEALASTDPDRALRIALSVTDDFWRAWALLGLADKLASSDPIRMGQVLSTVERLAGSITHEGLRGSVLESLARTLVSTDLVHAKDIADSITDLSDKVQALASVAAATADHDRARRLFDEAEHLIRSMAYDYQKEQAASALARALVPSDPDRALRLARSIKDESRKTGALVSIAISLTTAEPDRAEQLALSIPSDKDKASALAGIARAIAGVDPDRALRLAHSLQDGRSRADVISRVAATLVGTDPSRAARLFDDAEREARSITDHSARSLALEEIANKLESI